MDLTRQRLFISIASVVALLLLGSVAVYFATPRFTNEVEVNLAADERKSLEDQIAADRETIKSIGKKSDTPSVDQKYNLYLEIGRNLYKLGQYKDAREAYEEAAKLKADAYAVWEGLYTVDFARGDYVNAEKSLKTALVLYPNNPDYWVWYIDLSREKLGVDVQEIEQLFNQAFFKTNFHVDITIAYAKFLEAKGDLQGALNYWKQASQQEPKNEDYKKEIVRLEGLMK